MKIACLPDLHAWYSGPKDEQERIREFRSCMDEIFRVTQKEQVEYTIIPGDLYVSNRPSPAQVQEIIRNLNRLREPIVIAGNHDICAPGQPNFVSVLTAAMGIDCTDQPKSWATPTGDLAVAQIPFIKGLDDDQLLILLHAQIAAMPPAEHKIVVAHYATDISTYSSGEMAQGKEPCFRMADLEALPVDAVILGHIHKPAVLNDHPGQPTTKPIILHTGALTRRDHGEAKDQRGFYILTLDTVPTIEFFPLLAREFVTINPLKDQERDWKKCKDAYVRFKWQCTDEEWKAADTSAWQKKAEENGAFYITGFHPQIEHLERSRAEGLTENTSPEEGFKMWLTMQGISPELYAASVVEFEKQLQEVMG